MAEHDEGRVESRMAVVGRGFSATPERIAELQKRAETFEREATHTPTRSFSEILGQKPPPKVSRKVEFRNKRHAARPQKGPRPTIGQRSLRAQVGASDEKDEVILKG